MSHNRQTRKKTWIEFAVDNVGIRKGLTALTWAYSWAIVREAIGHDPSVEEVAEWWHQVPRSAYREQAAFRLAFPTLETPAKIVEDPAVREKFAQVARLADEAQTKLRGGSLSSERKAMRSRRSFLPADAAILELGMSEANV